MNWVDIFKGLIGSLLFQKAPRYLHALRNSWNGWYKNKVILWSLIGCALLGGAAYFIITTDKIKTIDIQQKVERKKEISNQALLDRERSLAQQQAEEAAQKAREEELAQQQARENEDIRVASPVLPEAIGGAPDRSTEMAQLPECDDAPRLMCDVFYPQFGGCVEIPQLRSSNCRPPARRDLAARSTASGYSLTELMRIRNEMLATIDRLVPQQLGELIMQARGGDVIAQTLVGWAHQDGRATHRDIHSALRWLHLAADKRFPIAEYSIGRIYYDGDGVAANYEEALTWFRRSAEQGYAAGENALGAMYEQGRGVPRDIGQAIKWYRRASEQGFTAATENLSRFGSFR